MDFDYLKDLGFHDDDVEEVVEKYTQDYDWFMSFEGQVCKVCYQQGGGEAWITGLIESVDLNKDNMLMPGTVVLKYFSKKRDDFTKRVFNHFTIKDIIPMKNHEQLVYKIKHNIQ